MAWITRYIDAQELAAEFWEDEHALADFFEAGVNKYKTHRVSDQMVEDLAVEIKLPALSLLKDLVERLEKATEGENND